MTPIPSTQTHEGWPRRVSLTTGVDTRIVRLGATGNGSCQVGTNPCT
jgi:hypothetical protein